MVTIRLSRGGAKKSPFYHIVVVDSRTRRDGRFIEKLGYFNPVARSNAPRLNINTEAVEKWRSQGAQISNRVAALIKEANNPQRFEKIKAAREKKRTAKLQAQAEAAAAAQKEATSEADMSSQ